MPPELVAQNSQTRARILDAAVGTFAAIGFRASTISSIAHSAGVNEVTVYRYFPKKRQLYWEALDYKLRNSDLIDLLVDTMTNATGPAQFLELVLTRSIEELSQDPTLARLLNFTVLELDRERALLFKTYLGPVMQVLTSRIEAWTRQGKIRPANSEAIAVAMIGLIISHYTLHQLFGFTPQAHLSPHQLATQYADICVAGLSPLPSAPKI